MNNINKPKLNKKGNYYKSIETLYLYFLLSISLWFVAVLYGYHEIRCSNLLRVNRITKGKDPFTFKARQIKLFKPPKEIKFRNDTLKLAQLQCEAGYVNESKKGATLRGLIFIKIFKSASSTMAGITLHISHRHSKSSKPCAAFWQHASAQKLAIKQRSKDSTFLFTFVRNPTSLFLSRLFFFDVTRGRLLMKGDIRKLRKKSDINKEMKRRGFLFLNSTNHTENEVKLLEHIKTKHDGNWSIDYIDPFNSTFSNLEGDIERILQEYEFVGIIERIDESLVVLRYLLDLNAGDILYIPSKISGQYDNAFDRMKCIKTEKPFISQEMNKYFASQEWYQKQLGDFRLYEMANAKLDKLIQQIDATKFRKMLEEHQYLMKQVELDCKEKVKYQFPCSPTGVKQSEIAKKFCYHYDYGCGYRCLNQVYEKYHKAGFKKIAH